MEKKIKVDITIIFFFFIDAIDEPKSQRLERPTHCPQELYSVMLQCWKHEPHLRPTFFQLCSILEANKPEQVRATISSPKGTIFCLIKLFFRLGTSFLEFH